MAPSCSSGLPGADGASIIPRHASHSLVQAILDKHLPGTMNERDQMLDALENEPEIALRDAVEAVLGGEISRATDAALDAAR